MPWKETNVMEQRTLFIDAWLTRQYSKTELCQRFGISRPTAHRRYDYALSVIAWRLNGRPVHHRRGRRFIVARAHGGNCLRH